MNVYQKFAVVIDFNWENGQFCLGVSFFFLVQHKKNVFFLLWRRWPLLFCSFNFDLEYFFFAATHNCYGVLFSEKSNKIGRVVRKTFSNTQRNCGAPEISFTKTQNYHRCKYKTIEKNFCENIWVCVSVLDVTVTLLWKQNKNPKYRGLHRI